MVLSIGSFGYIVSLNFQENKMDELSLLSKSMKEIKQTNEFKSLTPILAKVFDEAKANDIFISRLNIYKNKINLEIKSKNKNRVFKILTNYKNISINSIAHDEKNKEYTINASFKIYRK